MRFVILTPAEIEKSVILCYINTVIFVFKVLCVLHFVVNLAVLQNYKMIKLNRRNELFERVFLFLVSCRISKSSGTTKDISFFLFFFRNYYSDLSKLYQESMSRYRESRMARCSAVLCARAYIRRGMYIYARTLIPICIVHFRNEKHTTDKTTFVHCKYAAKSSKSTCSINITTQNRIRLNSRLLVANSIPNVFHFANLRYFGNTNVQ